MVKLVALCGLSGAGKDEAAKGLLSHHPFWVRCNFGDIIKVELDDAMRKHVGISAFTEIRSQKEQIRPILEQWGECSYERILSKYMAQVGLRVSLGHCVVNTRIMRLKEAKEWKQLGGVIVEIVRPGIVPATQWEAERTRELQESGMIDHAIINDGSPDELRQQLKSWLEDRDKADAAVLPEVRLAA